MDYMELEEEPVVQNYRDYIVTNTMPKDIYNYIDKTATSLNKSLGTSDNIKKMINNTFGKYQYITSPPGTDKTVGITVGFFILTPHYLTHDDVVSNKSVILPNNYKHYEMGYYGGASNIPIFEIDDKIKPNIVKEYGKDLEYFYFSTRDLSGKDNKPYFVSTSNFLDSRIKVFIFFCATYDYNPNTTITNGSRYAHVWLTTVYIDPVTSNYITNIFDTNSTTIFNIQYARMMSIMLETSKLNEYIPIVDPNYNRLYILKCQNKYSDFGKLESERKLCVGLQNSEKWGLCQTFVSVLYLYILEDPRLASYDIDKLVRIPKIYDTIYKLSGLISCGYELMETLKKPTLDSHRYVRHNDPLYWKYGKRTKKGRSKKKRSINT